MITLGGSPRERRLWHTLLDLAERVEAWTVVGARMVELHAIANGRVLGRASFDGDALGDARERPNPVRRLAEVLVDSGFHMTRLSAMGTGHAFVRGDIQIDVLAPENLGANSESARTTIPPLHTVEVPGGRQALERTEWVDVRVDDRHGRLPRPNLLGAILLKARAVGVDDAPDNQRSDLALLLSLADDPDALAGELRGRERSWLRRREMNDEDAACWVGMSLEERQKGLAALRILARM